MDLTSATTWATLYAATGLGYLLSRVVAVLQARGVLFGSRHAHLTGGVLVVVTASLLLLAALLWPLHVVYAAVRPRRRTL